MKKLDTLLAIYPILLNGQIFYAIWFDDGYSKFRLISSGEILAFRSEVEAEKSAGKFRKGLPIGRKQLLDLDACKKWVSKPSADSVDCDAFLSAYNAAGDYRNAAARANLDIGDKKYLQITDKLFWGCNLPSVTPKGKSYSPIWTKEEVKELRTMLEESIAIFESKLSVRAR